MSTASFDPDKDIIVAVSDNDVLVASDDSLMNKCNDSTSVNTTDCLSSPENMELDVTKITVLSLITILTVVGNLCVILAIVLRRMKMTRMYYFILHLSLADLLTAFFTLFPEIMWTLTYPHFYGGDILCRSIKFLQLIGPYLSSYVLIMTAIDRYQAICNPLSNCKWTPRRSNIMISVAWIIAFLLCIPQVFVFHGTDGNYCEENFPEPWGLKTYVTWFAFSNFFVPFLCLIYCYGMICRAIWDNFNSKTAGDFTNAKKGSAVSRLRERLRSSRRNAQSVRFQWRSQRANQGHQTGASIEVDDTEEGHKVLVDHPPSTSPTKIHTCNSKKNRRRRRRGGNSSSESSGSASPANNKSLENGVRFSAQTNPGKQLNPRTHSVRGISRAKIKTVKLTVVVILGYIVCSAPFICVQLWSVWGNPSMAVLSSLSWLFWLLTLNSVVNPWIYMFFNTNLVEALFKFCMCCDSSERRGAIPARSDTRTNANARLRSESSGMKMLKLRSSRSTTAYSAAEITGTTTLVPGTAASSESLQSRLRSSPRQAGDLITQV